MAASTKLIVTNVRFVSRLLPSFQNRIPILSSGLAGQNVLQKNTHNPSPSPLLGYYTCRFASTEPQRVSAIRNPLHPISVSPFLPTCSRVACLLPAAQVASGRAYSLLSSSNSRDILNLYQKSIAPLQHTPPQLVHQPHRTVTRYSIRKGKKKTVRAVIDRFYRLSNGMWVRTQAGRAKKLWKKSPRRRYRLKQHVFCNHTQSKMLDRMVTSYWKKRRYYVDDPFEQYHERNFNGYNFWPGERYVKTTKHK